jgi:hypothetical protein
MEPIGERTLHVDDGVEYDVLAAIDALPWGRELPPDAAPIRRSG